MFIRRELDVQDIEMMRLASFMDGNMEQEAKLKELLSFLDEMKLAHIIIKLFEEAPGEITYEAVKRRKIGFGTDMKGKNDHDSRTS